MHRTSTRTPGEIIASRIILNRAAALEGNRSRRAAWRRASEDWYALTGKHHPSSYWATFQESSS